MLSLVQRLWKEEEGQAMTEYGLILGIIAVAAITGLILMKDEIVKIFQSISGGLAGNAPTGS